jgi:hypothetical protein
MRGDILQCKALVMIFLVITLSFAVMNLDQVSAEEGAPRECCQMTNDQEACVYTTTDNCDYNGYTSTAATCEQTAYCAAGTCVSDVGQCSENVPKGTCEAAEYQWFEGPSSGQSTCQKGCCVIADYEASYTTQSHCKELISTLEDVELDWRDDVTSEAECSAIVRNSDRGCCVSNSDCVYGTRGECEDPQIDYAEERGFYSDAFCADLGQCGCESHDYTACVDEDVYWFDSCGNQEDVAENCDYLTGSWCEQQDGDAFCADISCDSTWDGKYFIDKSDPGNVGTEVQRNTHDERIGESREHGESWCLYESPVGDYRDRPGSQHYRSYCYFGEEVIEPCEDFREEICIQYPYGQSEIATGSACVANDNELLNPNITTVPPGSDFWNANDELAASCSQANIECPMLYVVTAYSDLKWQIGSNVDCVSPEYARDNAFFCAGQGDCGSSANLVETMTTNAFSMQSTQQNIGGDLAENSTEGEGKYREKTWVGYDSCVEGVEPPSQETTDRYCDDKELVCLGEDGDDCPFINSLGEAYEVGELTQTDYNRDWITTYDVSGNIIAISEAFDTLNEEYEGDAGFNTMSKILAVFAFGSVSAVAGVALGTAIAAGAFEGGIFALAGGAAGAQGAGTTLTTFSGAYGGTAGMGATHLTSVAAAVGALLLVTYQFWDVQRNSGSPLEALEKAQKYKMSSYIGAGVSAALFLAPQLIAGGASFGPWGLAVAAVILLVAALNYQGGKTQEITVSSVCEPWQPPTGSNFCELCDIPTAEGGLAISDYEGNILRGYDCTEYKCRSLGQNCEFISENVGSERPKCVGVAANDVNHPVITKYMVDVSENMNDDGIVDTEGYTDDSTSDYEFVPDDYVKFNTLMEPYQKVSFGIETDELSQCRLSQGTLPETYEEMDLAFPDSYFDYFHNQTWILTPEEVYDFYVRCQDHNGNYNIDAFVFQIETTGGVDITVPIIEAVSVNNGAYIAYDVTETPVSIFINEPADCKWSQVDQSYELMENAFLCSGIPSSATSLFDNECTYNLPVNATLPNYYYFACQDGAGNSNAENYGFTLQGTQPLLIDYVAPNGTIYYDYTELITQTSAGAKDGTAYCSYNGVGFYTTNKSSHNQPLQDLSAGLYNYYIECQDVAGNVANSSIEFTIEVDSTPPEISSLYLSGDSVHYTLNEQATCEALYEEFVYGEGIVSSGTFAVTELTKYYLICQDIFGNEGSWVIDV